MHSRFFENTVAEVMNACGTYSELLVRRALKNSCMLSSDVSAGFDPNYPEVMEKNNCAFLGHGLTFNKYTGSRGKSGSNDANPEYIARLRRTPSSVISITAFSPFIYPCTVNSPLLSLYFKP